ncbi:MAG: DUF948 domain-containing protein [Actinomycetes bacterium]|jgi:uncharacterized protein YoxC|nr:DUF948 domain-containing protein [Actinomycetes bacterium]
MDLTLIDWALVTTILKVVLMALGAIAFIVLIAVLVNLAKLLKTSKATMADVDRTVAELRDSTVPIVNKLNVTVDAVNAELLRLDSIIDQVEAAGHKVTSATEAVGNVVQTPVDIVSGIADKLRHNWKVKRAEAEDSRG